MSMLRMMILRLLVKQSSFVDGKLVMAQIVTDIQYLFETGSEEG